MKEKQAQAKQGILIMIFIILCATFIYAAYTHTLNSPTDDGWSAGLDVNFSGRCLMGSDNATNVSLWHDESGAFIFNTSVGSAMGNVLNNTDWNIILNMSGDNFTGITWNAKCVNATNSSFYTWLSGGNFTLKIDEVSPAVDNKYPATNTYWGNQTSIYFIAIGNETNPSSCFLYHNMTGSAVLNSTKTFVNDTDIIFDLVSPIGYDGLPVNWSVKCEDDAGNSDWGTNYTLYIDYSDPVIVIGNFTDDSWVNSYEDYCLVDDACNLTVSATVSDYNPDSCELWSDVAGTGFILNDTQSTITNGTLLSFTEWVGVAENSTGIIYNIWCNDSAGNSDWLQTVGNYTIKIDTTVPTAVTITVPHNDSTTADLSPTLQWSNSIDTNFESYILQASDTAAFTALWISEVVTTSNLTNYTSTVFDLSSNITDQTMYIRINSTDDAGQGISSSVYKINLKQSCSILEANQYSYCSIVRDTNSTPLSMYTIGTETGADYIYKWQSNHSWLTHTVGSTINKYENFSRGEVAVIHIATASGNQSWNGNRTWSVNTTYSGHAVLNFNFTNTSLSNWNLVPWINLSDTTFKSVFSSMNSTSTGTFNTTGDGNVTYFSYPNWNGTGLRYLGYVWGKGDPWNSTVIESGTGFWAAYDGSDTLAARWNWTYGG